MFVLAPGTSYDGQLIGGHWSFDFIGLVVFPCHLASFLLHLLSLFSSQISVPEATGPLALDSAPDFCAVGVLLSGILHH